MITIMLFVALPCSCSCPDWTNQTLSLLFSIYSGYPRKVRQGFSFGQNLQRHILSFYVIGFILFLSQWILIDCLSPGPVFEVNDLSTHTCVTRAWAHKTRVSCLSVNLDLEDGLRAETSIKEKLHTEPECATPASTSAY